MGSNKALSHVWWIGAMAALLVVLLFVGYWFAIARHVGPFVDLQSGGLFGDAFGALTSLFNALQLPGRLT